MDELRRLVNGYQVSQAISVATTLGVPDLLADGPRPCDELARKSGAEEYAELLDAAGFRLVGTTPTASGLTVFEAAPT